MKHAYSPRKMMGMNMDVPWDDLDNLQPDPGAFGVSPILGGRQPIRNADNGRRFSHMNDSARCCPPPVGSNQANPNHMPGQINTARMPKMPR